MLRGGEGVAVEELVAADAFLRAEAFAGVAFGVVCDANAMLVVVKVLGVGWVWRI